MEGVKEGGEDGRREVREEGREGGREGGRREGKLLHLKSLGSPMSALLIFFFGRLGRPFLKLEANGSLPSLIGAMGGRPIIVTSFSPVRGLKAAHVCVCVCVCVCVLNSN